MDSVSDQSKDCVSTRNVLRILSDMEPASVNNPAEWELSKENIQPLKGGRKAAKLNNILQPRDEETLKLLQEERQNFETELRSYNGPDPLDPWYR